MRFALLGGFWANFWKSCFRAISGPFLHSKMAQNFICQVSRPKSTKPTNLFGNVITPNFKERPDANLKKIVQLHLDYCNQGLISYQMHFFPSCNSRMWFVFLSDKVINKCEAELEKVLLEIRFHVEVNSNFEITILEDWMCVHAAERRDVLWYSDVH